MHTLSIQIPPNLSITTSGNPGVLAITLNSQGFGSATDSSTTYTVLSNMNNKKNMKITGAITSGWNMPKNTSLTIALSSKQGSSRGLQTLTTRAVDLVTNLPSLFSDTGSITYTFGVSNGWQIPAQSFSRIVTLTLTNG